MPNAYSKKNQENSTTQSKSTQQPAENIDFKPVEPEMTLDQLRNHAKEIASGIQNAGHTYLAQNILRKSQELTEDVNKLADLYKILMDPEVKELMAVIQAGKAINNEQGLPLQISVQLGKLPMSNPIASHLNGQYSFSRFYSQSSQSDSHQLLGANSESQS